MKPKLFIGSSVEGLETAYVVQQNLNHETESTVWTQGIFELSKHTLESLTESVNSSDFGVFIFTPDDILMMRGSEYSAARDNVLFEFGLFIGKLGRERVFFIVPDGSVVHIPTDLLGITPGKYDPNRSDKNLTAATGAACNQIRNQIKKLGHLNPIDSSKNTSNPIIKENSFSDGWGVDIDKADYKTAKLKLEKLLPNNKKDKNYLFYKAWLAYTNLELKQPGAAETLCEVFEEATAFPKIESLIPKMLMWAGRYDIAISLASKALSTAPTNINYIEMLAHCHEQEGSPTQAIEIINKSDFHETPTLALRLSQAHKDNGDLESALSATYASYKKHQNDTKIAYELAQNFQDLGYDKEALSIYDTLTKSNPNDSNNWGYLSNSCVNLELYNKAMEGCKKAQAISESRESWILLNIGNMLNNKGFYTDAIEWFKKGLAIESDSQYGHERLASALKNKEEEQKKYISILKEGRTLVKNFDPN